MHNPKVYIIIPFYNGDNFIVSCIESINNNITSATLEICIVNNSSERTKVHALVGEIQNVTIIDVEPKLGFGRANNIGAEYALKNEADFLIILNQDSILHSSCISNLIEPFYSVENIAVTAPITYSYDFAEIESHFIRWFLVQCPNLFYDSLQKDIKSFYYMKEISGACFAIRSEFVRDYGLFDPLYFMYMEDMDLCRKVRQLGYSLTLVPASMVAHAHSNTSEIITKRNEINYFKRKSTGIYILKETNKSLMFNLLKLLRLNIQDYIHLLTKFNIKSLLSSFLIDVRVLAQVKRIRESRDLEKGFTKSKILSF